MRIGLFLVCNDDVWLCGGIDNLVSGEVVVLVQGIGLISSCSCACRRKGCVIVLGRGRKSKSCTDEMIARKFLREL